LDPSSEKQLVHRAQQGDEAALKALILKYESRVASTVYGMLGSRPEADDVGQETFIRFYQSLGDFRGESTVGTYLTRIAINLCLNELRRQTRRRWLFSQKLDDVAESMADTDSYEQMEMSELAHKALHILEPEFRAVVVLWLMDGYSTAETAQILGIPVGTVLSRLSRAQKKLVQIVKTMSEPEKQIHYGVINE
jgi:RNA polymerase sigma-70 factor, ECF subfamily